MRSPSMLKAFLTAAIVLAAALPAAASIPQKLPQDLKAEDKSLVFRSVRVQREQRLVYILHPRLRGKVTLPIHAPLDPRAAEAASQGICAKFRKSLVAVSHGVADSQLPSLKLSRSGRVQGIFDPSQAPDMSDGADDGLLIPRSPQILTHVVCATRR